MRIQVPGRLKRLVLRFAGHSKGSIATTFALALIPIVTGVGAAIDYSRANTVKSSLQSALDAAVMAGARTGGSDWATTALNVFNGNMVGKGISSSTPTFSYDNSSTYSASVTASVATSTLGIIRVDSIGVGARSAAIVADSDNSCILTLDHGQSKSHQSLTLNGAPIVNLSGCSIRSNTSMSCNGNDGGVTKSFASGTASACGKPTSNAPVVPDIYVPLASNITTKCGSLRTGVTWTPGTLPTGSAFITVAMDGYTEYHVCGDLTLSGTGYLTGNPPPGDTVIVIENGDLNIANDAVINTSKTAIVMTGSNTFSAQINFPNGAGKKATLSLSPPTTSTNPWQAVALYVDPKLTKNIDNSWGPGAEFNADGLVYLGNSNVVTDGNTASANSKCTKFVMNSFTTNGHVNLNFAQDNCSTIGLKQWGGIVVHLVQ